jgi:hypothetical protein
MKHICPLCQSEYEKPEEKAMTDKEKFIEWWTPTVGKEAAEASWEEKQKQPKRMANMVISDIEGYISQVDGSWIDSRSKHKAHLKQHKMIELGNDPITQHKTVEIDRKSQEARKRAIAEATYAKLRY